MQNALNEAASTLGPLGVAAFAASLAALTWVGVTSGLTALREHRAKQVRGGWTEIQWAELRTNLMREVYAQSQGQLLDVRLSKLRKGTRLGHHFSTALTLAERHGYLTQNRLTTGWGGRVAQQFSKSRDAGTDLYVRFTHEGLNAFRAAEEQGVLLDSQIGQAIAVFNGTVHQVQLNQPGAHGRQL